MRPMYDEERTDLKKSDGSESRPYLWGLLVYNNFLAANFQIC